MLKAKKRLTKRQIKEDKFVTYYFQVSNYLQENARNLVYGAVAVVLVLLALFFYFDKQEEKNAQAAVMLARARAAYDQEDYQTAADSLQALVDLFGGTQSGKIGLFYLANCRYQLQEFEEAERLFRKYAEEGDDEVLKASALSGVAACLEQQGRLAEAASLYQKVASDYKDSFLAPENLYNAARCYALAGNREAARSTLEKLIRDYASSQKKNDAEVFLAELRS